MGKPPPHGISWPNMIVRLKERPDDWDRNHRRKQSKRPPGKPVEMPSGFLGNSGQIRRP
jgi:hypothetical protein